MGTVVDTVVLHYFLLVDRVDLLIALLSAPVVVPRIVFDPDETGRGVGSSEIARAIAYEERIAASPEEAEHEKARTNAERLASLSSWVESGAVTVADLTDDEWRLLTAIRAGATGTLSVVPLGMGESACLAMGINRGYVVATDDTLALKALEQRSPGHPYERIRKLLVRAAEQRLITRSEADALHAEMRALGFWDTSPPFGSTRSV